MLLLLKKGLAVSVDSFDQSILSALQVSIGKLACAGGYNE